MNKKADITEKEFYEFLELLSKLNPIEFIGIATWLRVPQFSDEKRENPRPIEDVMSDIMDAFISLSHTKRKQIVSTMKDAIHAHLKKK